MPVVVLEGPRASGKTSIGALLQARRRIATIADLGDPTVLDAVTSSPTSFVDNLPVPAFIDEAQLAPELLLAIKRRVDRERRPGCFVLTGSSRFGRAQLGGSDPLAGRSIRLRVWPMTQGELAGQPKNLVRQLFAANLGAALPNACTSRLLNISAVANDTAASRETVSSRLASLNACFLTHLLAGHRSAEHRSLTAHPKVHAIDIGLAAWAARIDEAPPAALFGGLVETLVINELAAQAQWTGSVIEVRHWRDTARKAEVDAVMTDDSSGQCVGIEVKAARDVRPGDLTGMRQFLSTVDGAVRGVVFYTGGLTLALDDRITAVPISALWNGLAPARTRGRPTT